MGISDWSSDVCSSDLRNAIERTMILAPGDRIGRIDVDMLPPEVTGGGAGDGVSHTTIMGSPLRVARESFEREYLKIRSEERRVGKEWGSTCRSRWSADHVKTKRITTQTKNHRN